MLALKLPTATDAVKNNKYILKFEPFALQIDLHASCRTPGMTLRVAADAHGMWRLHRDSILLVLLTF